VGLFRRKPLHERLAEQGGLDHATSSDAVTADADPAELEETWFGDRSILPFERLSGEVTLARPRRWDVVVSVEAEGIGGDEVEFVTLPDRSLIVDEERGDADLTPLAEAVETQIAPPYRARGVRKSDRVWSVAARRIAVAEFESDGDELELASHRGEQTLVIDGNRVFGRRPELERFVEGDAVIRASRLDDNLWEVRVDPL
jgi:hypothetical protein